MKKTILTALPMAAIAFAFGTYWVSAQSTGGMHGMMHGMFGGMMGGHDEANMPMLNGKDTSPEEVADLRMLFTDHTEISRSVTNLPNGIRTITETENDALRAALVSHVVGMIDRVDQERDPQIPIQSPTLDLLFRRPELIVTTIEPTDLGVAVVQTSDDPEMVAALQTHAAEVSDLAARGMESVHEAMMKRMNGGN